MLRKMDTYAVADAMQLPMNGESLRSAPAARPFSHTPTLAASAVYPPPACLLPPLLLD